MSDLTSSNSASETPAPPSPLRCFLGSGVAAAIAFACWTMTHAIAQSFASHPIHSAQTITIRIAVAVRTLVVGLSALGTGVFGLAALGLFLLGVQLLLKRKDSATPT